jgi:hypothetical protein
MQKTKKYHRFLELILKGVMPPEMAAHREAEQVKGE